MRTRRTVLALSGATLVLLSVGGRGWSALRSDHALPIHPASAIIDNDDRMDANNLDMVVTNHGSLAYDLTTGNAGLIFPRGSTKTVVFASGIWVGARVAGETRATVAEYSQEFAPGPMANGTFRPDEFAFQNYRIGRGGVGYADYLNYAVPQGAPTDAVGNPLLLGDATIWSVFNDADPARHATDAGGTTPLGLEVQQTVFAFNRSGPLGNTIYMKFKLINKGGNTLEDAFVSFWSDPDLGGFTDDLVACDSTLDIGYCYNATNSDQQYGSSPPAVGFCLIRGPIVSVSPGVFDTLGMTAFAKYINGTDPVAPEETYNYMRGLHADGTPVHVNDDPALPITTYQVSGDPVAGTGWLDTNPADRRLFVSSGPFRMAPGDAQEITVAVIVGQGNDRLASVASLRSAVPTVRSLADGGVPSVLAAALDLDPNVINLASPSPWVTAYIEIPGADPVSIDLSSLRLAGSVAAESKFASVGDHDQNGIPDVEVKFGRVALDPLMTIGVNELAVTGTLTTGRAFRGVDEVRVIAPPRASLATSVAPNPLNPAGALTFVTTRDGPARVILFDLHGRVVRTLLDERIVRAGRHEIPIDGRSVNGEELSSGVYFYRLEEADGVTTGRLVIAR